MSESELIVRAINMMTMNMASRFTGREIKPYGQEILHALLVEKNVGIFFGQQLNFRPRLPPNYEYIGGSKAFILYNKAEFRTNDEKKYRQYIKDLQLDGQLPHQYLPEQSYVVIKVKSKHRPKVEFIAMSWVTDDCAQEPKNLSAFKKVTDFATTLSIVERLPVVLGGTFRISMDDALEWLPAEMRLHSYAVSAHPRRSKRAMNLLISSSDVDVDEVQTLTCGQLRIDNMHRVKGVNFEDAFVCDPVKATMFFMPLKNPRGPRKFRSVDIIPDFVDTPSPRHSPLPPQLSPTPPPPPPKNMNLEVEEQEVHITLEDEEPLEMPDLGGFHNGNLNVLSPNNNHVVSPKTVVLREGDYSHMYDEDLIAKSNWCYMS